MNKFMTTFSQTYISKIRAKSFIFTTLLIVLLVFAGANFDKIIDLFDSSEDIATVEVNADENIAGQFEAMLGSMSDNIEVVDADGDAVVTIEDSQPLSAEVSSENEISSNQSSEIELALNELNRQSIINSLELTEEDAALLTSEVSVQYDVTSETDDSSAADESGMEPLNIVIFYIAVLGMFMIIINYASQIAMEISMEKSSRVIEMIVSSVKPVSHVLAKISAIILVSFTQLFVIVIAIVSAIYIFNLNEVFDEFGLEVSDNTVPMLIYSIIFLVLGLVLYLTVSAMLGSFVNRMEDLQQALMPITFMSIAGLYLGMFNLMTPDTLLVKITSYFPFFTPFVMPLRILDGETSQATLLIGIAILIVTIVISVFLAASIYRNSVLSTEKGIIKNLKRIRKQ
ncbi:ABC transporter permease [Corticicoccus populi]|uniref:ABC transporter permease n=1 Tax=Corticicoccus populi TaxID=1812821 RepID=A0ABW5WXA6_9STAP